MISKRKQEHESSLEDIFAHHDDHLHALELTSGGNVDGDGVGVMRGVPVCVVWSHTRCLAHEISWPSTSTLPSDIIVTDKLQPAGSQWYKVY